MTRIPLPSPLNEFPIRLLPVRLRSLLTTLPGALSNPLGYPTAMHRQYGGLVCLAYRRAYLVAAPDHVQHVLQERHPIYGKGPRYQVLKPISATGFLCPTARSGGGSGGLTAPATARPGGDLVRACGHEGDQPLDRPAGRLRRRSRPRGGDHRADSRNPAHAFFRFGV